jgi:hypothetical protein
LNDALGLGGVVQPAVELRPGLRGLGEEFLNAEQMRQRNAAQPAAALPEKLAARRKASEWAPGWHRSTPRIGGRTLVYPTSDLPSNS